MSEEHEWERNEDPGWYEAIRGLALWLMPVIAIRRQQRTAREGRFDGLIMLRSMFVAYATALVLVGGVVAVLTNFGRLGASTVPVGTVAGGVALFGVAALAASRALSRPLDCTSLETLATTYRTRFFVRLAFADAAALLGFVGFIYTDRWWLYLLGGAFAAVGFFWLAPTSTRLAQEQDRLNHSACALPLISALRTAMPPPSTRRRR